MKPHEVEAQKHVKELLRAKDANQIMDIFQDIVNKVPNNYDLGELTRSIIDTYVSEVSVY